MPDEVILSQSSITQLADALRAVGNNAPRNNATPSRGRNTNFSTKEVGEAYTSLTGFIAAAGGDVSTFANAMGGGAVGIKLFSGIIENSVGYVEGLNNTFQNLSKVGAGFNGDLGALAAAASNTRMQVGEFADVVGANAKDLAGLGAGVNKGATRFAELSRAMFEDGQVIEGMLNLGYNIRESNEALLDNATLLSRQQRLTGMSDEQVAQATLSMAANMAEIAEVSGKSAKQQRDELMDASRDGKNIAANRALENQGITDASQTFNQVFTALGPLGSAAQAYAQDMNQARAPLSKLTQNFATIAPQTAAIISQMDAVRKSNMSTEEKTARIRALEARARQAYALEMNSTQVLSAARIGQINDRGATAADMIGETERFRQGVEQARADIAKERAEASGQEYTGGYGDVTMAEAETALRQSIADRVNAQTGGGDNEQAVSREINLATIGLANTAASVNQEIGRNLSANTELQESVAAAYRGLVSASGIIAATAEKALGLLPGTVDDEKISLNPFREVFKETSFANGALRTNIDNFNDIADVMSSQTKEDLRKMFDDPPGKALGGSVTANSPYRVGEYGEETFVPGMDGAIIPNMKAALNRMPDMAKQLKQEMEQLGAPITKAAQAASAVSSQESKSLASMKTAMTNLKSDDIGALIQHTQTTNDLLTRLLGVNTTQMRVGEKQLKTTRGTGNLMTGLGRA